MTRSTMGFLSLLTVVLVFFASCNENPASPDASVPSIRETVYDILGNNVRLVPTVSGDLVSQHELELQLAELARDLATTLNNPDMRGRIFEAIHGSPFREQKLHFRTLLADEQIGLARALNSFRGADNDIFSRLDSLIDLEFYMPVPEHLEKWRRDSELLVVSFPTDEPGISPRGFDLNGNEVPVSMSSPPDVPTLVLTGVGTDFSSLGNNEGEVGHGPTPMNDPVTGGEVVNDAGSYL